MDRLKCKRVNAESNTTLKRLTGLLSITWTQITVRAFHGPCYDATTKDTAGSSGCPIFDRNENVVAIHSGVRPAKGADRLGQRTNHGAILDDEDNDADAFRAVLKYLGQEKIGAMKFMSQGMSIGVTRYTVEDYGVDI